MDEITEHFQNPATAKRVAEDDATLKRSSHVFNVSLRGWIALIVVLTICGMSALKIQVAEPLYTIGGMIVAFYFGQIEKPKPKG